MSLKERFSKWAQGLLREEAPVDPASFGDPLATRVEWTPLARGGANFRTHRLREIAPGRYEFRASMALFIFAGVFVAAGIAVMAFTWIEAPGLDADEQPPWLALVPVAFGALFMLVGLLLASYFGRPRVFDRATGWYWIGRQSPLAPQGDRAKSCRLSDIHALQIIRERVRSKNSSYWSYELNLVLRDGHRLHVVDHGNRESLLQDAQQLARMLGCRLWDASAPQPAPEAARSTAQ